MALQAYQRGLSPAYAAPRDNSIVPYCAYANATTAENTRGIIGQLLILYASQAPFWPVGHHLGLARPIPPRLSEALEPVELG